MKSAVGSIFPVQFSNQFQCQGNKANLFVFDIRIVNIPSFKEDSGILGKANNKLRISNPEFSSRLLSFISKLNSRTKQDLSTALREIEQYDPFRIVLEKVLTKPEDPPLTQPVVPLPTSVENRPERHSKPSDADNLAAGQLVFSPLVPFLSANTDTPERSVLIHREVPELIWRSIFEDVRFATLRKEASTISSWCNSSAQPVNDEAQLANFRIKLAQVLTNLVANIELGGVAPILLGAGRGCAHWLPELKNASNVLKTNEFLVEFRKRLPELGPKIELNDAAAIVRVLEPVRRRNQQLFEYCAVIVWDHLDDTTQAPRVARLAHQITGESDLKNSPYNMFIDFSLTNAGTIASAIQTTSDNFLGMREVNENTLRFCALRNAIHSEIPIDSFNDWNARLKKSTALVSVSLEDRLRTLPSEIKAILAFPARLDAGDQISGDRVQTNDIVELVREKLSLLRKLNSTSYALPLNRLVGLTNTAVENYVNHSLERIVNEASQVREADVECFAAACATGAMLSSLLYGEEYSQIFLRKVSNAQNSKLTPG